MWVFGGEIGRRGEVCRVADRPKRSVIFFSD